MNAERFNRCWTWIGVGAVVGYVVPILVASPILLYSWYCNGALDTDALWMLPLLILFYTVFGLWLSYSILGAGCGFACAWLLPRLGRWRRLGALTVFVLLASVAACALHCRWFIPLWPS